MPQIRFENVVKRFEGRDVLAGVSFTVEKGEILAIVGPSGTGKSVTLKHLVRLLTPTSGSVWLDDVEISSATGRDLESIRNRFGYLFQGGALLGWLTVAENVALPLREHGGRLTEQEINERVDEAGLARAIVRRNDIILYDEPTSGLDPVTSVTINNLIRRLNKERGITSIVVTHDLQGALLFVDRVLMLKDGHVVEVSEPADFVKSTNPDVREFLDAQLITPDILERRDKNE